MSLELHAKAKEEPTMNEYMKEFYREEIARKLEIKDQTIRNAISKLSKLNLLIKQGTGVYILNPNHFGIGDWSSLKGLRMTIEYTNEGKKIEVKEIEGNENEI